MSTIEQSILQMVMIPRVRDISIGYFQDWMFTSELNQALFKVIKDPKLQNRLPDPREVVLTLHTVHKISEEDCTLAYRIVQDAVDTREYDIENHIFHITEFIRDRMMGRGVELIATAGSAANNKVKGQSFLQQALNFTISTDQFYDFSQTDNIKTAQDLDFPPGGVIIKSHFSLVNKSSLYNGYKYGDLVMICAKPAGGKSTSLVDEGAYACYQHFKVCHLFLGDMSEYDAFIKYLSYWSGATTNEIISHGYEQYLTPEIVAMFRRLRVKALPADTYDIYQVISKINQLRAEFEFDLLIIDYDANIKSVSDNMYGEGGNTYANLKSYGQNRCAVLIGSQTKTAFWDHEIVPIEAPAESSKKAHHVDMMLTFGRNKTCPKLGTLNIAKMRRGESEVQVRLHMDYAFTRVREISQDVYNSMLAEHKAAQLEKENVTSDGVGEDNNSGFAAD